MRDRNDFMEDAIIFKCVSASKPIRGGGRVGEQGSGVRVGVRVRHRGQGRGSGSGVRGAAS